MTTRYADATTVSLTADELHILNHPNRFLRCLSVPCAMESWLEDFIDDGGDLGQVDGKTHAFIVPDFTAAGDLSIDTLITLSPRDQDIELSLYGLVAVTDGRWIVTVGLSL